MRNQYSVTICMPMYKESKIIKADFYKISKGRMDFIKRVEGELFLLCSYPSKYIVIEKIKIQK